MRHLRWVALLTMMFACVLGLARAVGGQAKRLSMQDFSEVTLPGGQRQVCWRGMCPGLTTMLNAQVQMLHMIGFSALFDPSRTPGIDCWESTQGTMTVCLTGIDVLDVLSISFHSGKDPALQAASELKPIPIGDLMLQWGPPVGRSDIFCANALIEFSNGATTNIRWEPTSTYAVSPDSFDSWVSTPNSFPGGDITLLVVGEQAPTQATWDGFRSLHGPALCGND